MFGKPSMELSNLPLLLYIVLAYPSKSVFTGAKKHKKDGSKRRKFARRIAATVPCSLNVLNIFGILIPSLKVQTLLQLDKATNCTWKGGLSGCLGN
jgi:hypothetical protein